MKIMVIGYSGSGKSTLAEYLGKKYQIPILHLDHIFWLPGWEPPQGGNAGDGCLFYGRTFLLGH